MYSLKQKKVINYILENKVSPYQTRKNNIQFKNRVRPYGLYSGNPV